MLPRRTFEDRFWSKVTPQDSGCWLWTAARDKNGYGRVGVGSKTAFAHRISWEIANGEIRGGLSVLHSCDVPACVNPAHLFLGSQADNMRDMHAKRRGVIPASVRMFGERNGAAKLSESTVLEIKSLAGVISQRAVATRYGISPAHVCRIQRGERWQHAAS
ncbi:HNH endonuclease signature motif containing protein [Sphingomonas melonis]|uniref:HNH endonuclease signature motif containing protein n=1 Tax=Sphingomonas melonis TaxID=152682 RepID=UPI0015CB7A40